MIGREQRFHPSYSMAEKVYISLFGVPVIGLRIRARNILRLLPNDLRPREILDAGSGPGVITFMLAARYPAARATGVDLQEGEIKASRAIAARAKISNAHFETADISALPFRNRFDLIVCVDILEHIEDDRRALEKLLEALKPGGTLLLHVPALTRRFPVFKKTANFDVPGHIRVGYEIQDILAKVEHAGFMVEKKGYTYGFLETLANNISFMITGARKKNKGLYALTFPLLNIIGWFGRGSHPSTLGAGIYLLADRTEEIGS